MTKHTDAQYEPTDDQKKRTAFHKSVVDNADALKAHAQREDELKHYYFAYNEGGLALFYPSDLSLKEAVDTTIETIRREREQARQELLDELEKEIEDMGGYPDGKTRMFNASLITDFINAKRKKGGDGR